jgi:large subunit ribosomal protein L9
MLVILRENVENLGLIGDVVKVPDGYARNYLLPRKLVMQADENNVAQIEQQKKALEKRRLAVKAASQELSTKLSEVTVTINRKVGEHDKLFGSVSAGDIAEELKKAGYTVERRKIHIEHPIKTLGVHPVSIKLDTDITATVKVWVVKEA